MERLNQMIEEYVIENFDDYREEIDSMYEKNKDDIDEANKELREWLFNEGDLGDTDADTISFTDWLQSTYDDYFDNFLKEMTALELIAILKYMTIEDFNSGLSAIGELFDTGNDGQIERTIVIITNYSIAWGDYYINAYDSCGLSYVSILNMIDKRVIPK
jgi:hypothetical protein